MLTIAAVAGQTPGTNTAWKIENHATRLVLGIQADSMMAEAAAVLQEDRPSRSQLWNFMPAGNRYKIVNLGSGELLGVERGSQAADAAIIHTADTGTSDHLWQFAESAGEYVKLTNVGSNLVLAAGPSNAAVQMPEGNSQELWSLIASGPAYPDPLVVTGDTTVHDPSLIKTKQGTYYLFGTHRGIPVSSSPDRIHFTSEGQAFAAIPEWVSAYSPNHDLWAPDVSWRDGKYWLYYAASRFGSQISAIGLAISSTAAPGSWSDQGMVIDSHDGSAWNAIDPGLVLDASGAPWLTFGSFWDGINLIRIDPSTGKQSGRDRRTYPLAHRPASPAIEGAYIYPHQRYYYLFASFDQCCHGVRSTYHIVVGRSSTITGPYIDRGGVAMALGGGTVLLSSHGRYIGPGGQTVIRDGSEDYLVYHYYDADASGAPALGINQLTWDSAGWPHVCNSSPATRVPAPSTLK